MDIIDGLYAFKKGIDIVGCEDCNWVGEIDEDLEDFTCPDCKSSYIFTLKYNYNHIHHELDELDSMEVAELIVKMQEKKHEAN